MQPRAAFVARGGRVRGDGETRWFKPTQQLLGALAVGILLVAHPLLVATALAQESKPNILFILADNIGFGDVGVYGGGELRGSPTPRIGQLAAEGLRLTACRRAVGWLTFAGIRSSLRGQMGYD